MIMPAIIETVKETLSMLQWNMLILMVLDPYHSCIQCKLHK